ncbi:MAG: ion transporter [Gammaproteobacteria bacterium]|nr:MAG: ion transporter [Gammaproteobacteria bacterium]RLA57636.1 MAG: ion transporter [Gammaproteobacteria bacterium]
MALRQQSPLQLRFYEVIFGTETLMGKWFDISLILIIVASVTVIMLDSIAETHVHHGTLYRQLEWVFTLMFTLEYMVRVWCSPNRKGYMFSVYGIVDLLALLPTYLSLLLPQTAPLLIIRLLRILRIFRVLRLLSLLNEANAMAAALRSSARKIFVFYALMLILTTIFGSLMYVVEGAENGFDNIPKSIYWAIVTITTVGYGDVVPLTPIGRAISSVGMLIGYSLITVPAVIMMAPLAASEQARRDRQAQESRNCTNCTTVEHDTSSHYCRNCGAALPKPGHEPET